MAVLVDIQDAIIALSHMCSKYKTKRQAGRTVDYRNQGLGYKLNYCPECGRKIRG